MRVRTLFVCKKLKTWALQGAPIGPLGRRALGERPCRGSTRAPRPGPSDRALQGPSAAPRGVGPHVRCSAWPRSQLPRGSFGWLQLPRALLGPPLRRMRAASFEKGTWVSCGHAFGHAHGGAFVFNARVGSTCCLLVNVWFSYGSWRCLGVLGGSLLFLRGPFAD